MTTSDTFLRTAPNGDTVDIRNVAKDGCCPRCFEYIEDEPCACGTHVALVFPDGTAQGWNANGNIVWTLG